MGEGGWEVVRAEHLQACWKEKYEEWLKRPKTKLPKWFGERPGKKPGDPESPEDEEEGGAEAAPEPYEEEEEEEEMKISFHLLLTFLQQELLLLPFFRFLMCDI